jgi:tetratricopeptide (TPR) repeat protein
MKRSIIIIGLACVFIIIASCNPSKKFIKDANTAALSGDHDAAANLYYNALLVKPSDPIALKGLKEHGDIVLQRKFGEFGKYVVANAEEESVNQYLACKKYFNRCQKVGVTLEWTNLYDDVYEEIKNAYITKKYEEGLLLMKENKYEKAELIFNKIANVDSTYKDVTVLRIKSIAEPLYQRGTKYLTAENYKEALGDFDKVLAVDINYKNTKFLKEETLRKGAVGLGVLPVQNQTQSIGFDQKLYQQLIATLVKNKNPFLKVIDRSALEAMLREQQLGMSGLVDPESAAKAGLLIGLKYVLMTAISDLVYEDIGPITDSIVAFEAFTETITLPTSNFPQSVTRFKKVKYADTFQKRKLYYRVFYQLVSTQTGQVVASEVISEERIDEFHNSKYNGNVNALYPELPKNNQLPPKPTEFREQFNQVKRFITSKEEMTHEICRSIAEKLNADIILYIDK